MKKNIILVLLWLISIVLFVSCSQDAPAQFGTLELNINSEVSRGIQAVSMETASYNITVNDSSENVVFSSTGNAQSSYSVSVLAGTYNVYVEALNNEGDVIGAGSSAVVVKASQVNSCSITVYELTGNGTFGISITANEGYPLAYSIKMADGTEVKDGNLEYSNGRYAVSEELANGFYVFKITRTDTNKVLKTDAIRIIKDKAVSYSATFQFLSDGTIVIVNEISGTPTIDISINKATFNAGDMLKASAVISDIDEGYTCFWLIDGVAVTEAGAYEDLSYEIPESDETEHEVALVVLNGSVIWSDSYTFHVVDHKYNTELEVEGAVELWLVGDVLIPRDFKAFVSYGDKIVVLQSTQSHFVFDVGDRVILTCSLSDSDYSYHFESSYNEATETTVCYVVIDRDIENPGYIKVNFGDIPSLDYSMSFGVWLYGENTILNPNNSNERYKHFGLVVVTNDRNPRIIKVDPDEYYQCAVHGRNYELFDISKIDRTRFTVSERETKETTISISAFDSLINVDLTGLTADAIFTEMAEAIYLYVGEAIVGSWTSPDYFNNWPESQQRGLYAGENYEVKAVIVLKTGVSEEEFPYKIVPDINTLTVEADHTYTVKFTTIEKESHAHSIRVLNYLDASDSNYSNEIAQVWGKFATDHPDIEIIREDLSGEAFHQKVEAYTAKDQLPDVMFAWPSGRSSILHEEGLLYDLEQLLIRDGLFDDYLETCTAPQLGGYLGVLPSEIIATSMMFVNEKVLRENNLEIPETYNDLKAMVPVLNAKGIEVISMDCQDGWVMQSCLFSLIAGRFGGSDWYDRLVAGEIDFEDDWFKDALTIVDNLYKDGIINRDTLSVSYGSGRADFAAGRSAFYIDGDWACDMFLYSEDGLFTPEQQIADISLMNFPALEGEIVHESNSAVVGTGWAISADIDPAKLEDAWTLVKYLEGEYVQTWRLVHGVSFPSLVTLDVEDICEENNLEPLVAKRADWYNNIQVATPIIDGVLDVSVYEVINTVLAEIGNGNMTVDQAASAVNTAWYNYSGL